MKFTMGSVIGGLTQTTMIGASYLTNGIGQLSDKIIKDEKKKIQIKTKVSKISSSLSDSSVDIADKVSKTIDKAIVKSGELTGKLSKQVAIAMNSSEKNIATAEKIGTVVGKVALGGGIGLATSVALTSTLVTTGGSASAFTASLAALGGGSVATGGAGMAGGLIAAEAITSAVTATTVVATINTKPEIKEQKLHSKKKKVV